MWEKKNKNVFKVIKLEPVELFLMTEGPLGLTVCSVGPAAWDIFDLYEEEEIFI